VTPGSTIFDSTFLTGNYTDDSYCSMGMLELPRCGKTGRQATQKVYKITVIKEYAKINDLTRTINVTSGVISRAVDSSLTDTMEGAKV
jgi:hypothetical protein